MTSVYLCITLMLIYYFWIQMFDMFPQNTQMCKKYSCAILTLLICFLYCVIASSKLMFNHEMYFCVTSVNLNKTSMTSETIFCQLNLIRFLDEVYHVLKISSIEKNSLKTDSFPHNPHSASHINVHFYFKTFPHFFLPWSVYIYFLKHPVFIKQ